MEYCIDVAMKPARSRDFMRFAHGTKPHPCCVCKKKPFTQLHHFGDDGGMGMKPSDYQVARLCKSCADRWEIKRRALIKNGYYEILSMFQKDALELHEGWLRVVEDAAANNLSSRCGSCAYCDSGSCCAVLDHVEPDASCALDELSEAMAGGDIDFPWMNPIEARDWMIEWSNRRSANVIGFFVEHLLEIAGKKADDCETGLRECRFIASQALKVAGVEVTCRKAK